MPFLSTLPHFRGLPETLIENSRKYKLIYSDRKQISGCLGINERGKRKLLGTMEMFIIVIAMMVSQVYTYIETYQIMHFKYMQFLVC